LLSKYRWHWDFSSSSRFKPGRFGVGQGVPGPAHGFEKIDRLEELLEEEGGVVGFL
jgi:hypothetical protein